MNVLWVEKYRPTNYNLMVGNEETRLNFIKWLKNWTKKSKPALLLGPAGVGKTTLVHTVARTVGFEVLELNASDVRTKTKLEMRLGPSRLNTTLFEEKLLIFLDEIDGLYGRQDKGGIEFIQDLIKHTKSPVVMIANVEDDKKIEKLAKTSQVFRFRRVPPKLLEMVIKSILRREGLALDQNMIERIVRDAQGDVRAAVNSVQVAAAGTGEIMSGIRDTQISLVDSLKIYFDSSSNKEAYMALSACNAQPKEKIRAIFQSIISSRLDGKKLIEILEELSKADELIAKIGITQNYRLLRYFNQILATSVFKALKGTDIRYGKESLPWNLQIRIWNESRQLRYIASRIADQHHVSSRDAFLFYLPYIAYLSRLKNYESKIIDRLRLDESMIKVFRKEAQKVVKEIAKG